MVLDFGGLKSPLFNISNISGQGLAGNSSQSVLNEESDVGVIYAELSDWQGSAIFEAGLGAAYLVDGNVATNGGGNAVGDYATFTFAGITKFKRWRQYGDTANSGVAGVFNVQYLSPNSGLYVDWFTFETLDSNTWSSYTNVTEIRTSRIKITCTTVNGSGTNYIGELEIIY